MIKRIYLIFYIFLIIHSIQAQVSVYKNLNLQLVERDSITAGRIENALNGFLTEAKERTYSEKYVDTKHLKKYEFFFNKLGGIGKGSEIFHKPTVLKSYPIANGAYRLTIGFTGNKEGIPFIYQITELKAVPYNDSYRFYCPFIENTKHFKTKTIENIKYYYSSVINEMKAKEFVEFTKKLAKLTSAPIPKLDYYSFSSLDELLKSYGFLYSARQCNFLCYDLGFMDNEGKTYITGTDNENYVFGYISDFFYYNLPDKEEIYWTFVQGISAYYGGYGLSHDDIATLKSQFSDELKRKPNINFLEEFQKGRKSTINRRFSHYVMSAFLFKEILEKKGFDEALKLVYSGKDGERFFEILNTTLGVNKHNFHKTIVKLIAD